MGIIQFEQNGVNYLLPEIPDDFREYAGANNNELFYWTDTCKQSYGDYPYSIHVPNVLNYEIIAFTNNITEEQAAEMVNIKESGMLLDIFKSYTRDPVYCTSAIDSLKSRIRSLGGSDDANYIIFKSI